MRKALALALAGLCLGSSLAPAADFTASRVEAVPAAHLGLALQTALPRLDLPPAELGTLSILAARFQEASLSGPAFNAPSEVVPLGKGLTPALVAPALSELRAQYSDDALRDMPAAELNLVAQRFFDRMRASSSGTRAVPFSEPSAAVLDRRTQTTQTAAPAVPQPLRSLYLLSKPLEVSARLGPVARIGHYAFEIGFHLVKSYLLLRAGVHIAPVALEFLWSAAKAPAMISVQSMGDLQARYWWKKLRTLKQLARIPGVERIAVLTGTETHFSKVVAKSQDNRGLIFLESSTPLRALSTMGQGEPILIEDPAAARIHLSLEVAGRTHDAAWTPTLKDLLDRKAMPRDVADDWRRQIHDAKKDMTPWRRFFDADFERNLKVHAVLIDASGRRTELGVLSQGQSTKHLLGITRIDQARRWLAAALGLGPSRITTLFDRPSIHPERSIPLGDTSVERGPTKASWRQVPGRLWKRLLGRLIIVAP